MATEGRFVFVVDWYDQPAELIRKYQLTYFLTDNTIQMVILTQYDLKNRRIFLKRCQYPQLQLSDIFIGGTLSIYSRQLKVVQYGDVFTRQSFENQRQKTFAMIKPDAYNHIGKIIDAILQSGFRISNLIMRRLTVGQAQQFYGQHQGKPFFQDLINFVTSDVVVGLELVKQNAIQEWRALIGPTNSNIAKQQAPGSLRAMFGTDNTRNAVHGSDSPASVRRESEFFFGIRGNPAILNNCTCCLVLPHCFQSAGKVIDQVLEEGFEISAMQLFNLDKPTAEEFYEVYKGVLPEFIGKVDQLTSGPLIALEVRQENAVQSFRQICGPLDPEVARTLRPDTLRARNGVDRVMNGVHCTDLPEDGILECEYFFKILAN